MARNRLEADSREAEPGGFWAARFDFIACCRLPAASRELSLVAAFLFAFGLAQQFGQLVFQGLAHKVLGHHFAVLANQH